MIRENHNKSFLGYFDLVVVIFILLLMFILPVIFTRQEGNILWINVMKIWQDKFLIIPVFVLNHWLLVPKLVLNKKYILYLVSISLLVTLVTAAYYFYDNPRESGNVQRPPARREDRGRRNDIPPVPVQQQRPQPVPPYAELLIYTLLIVSVDTGLSFTKYWQRSEDEKIMLEKKNVEAQLGMLRNQVSPHFLMNTLNNIYSLIDADWERSKQSVMKLSKLMRYLLYENQGKKIHLSKEFEFIRSYVDLMKLRYVDDVEIRLNIPEIHSDPEIPGLLFISYLENAFKYGTSYERKSFIEISFQLDDNFLYFSCLNSRNVFQDNSKTGGLGLDNSRKRLDLLYNESYNLLIEEKEDIYSVRLKIPLA